MMNNLSDRIRSAALTAGLDPESMRLATPPAAPTPTTIAPAYAVHIPPPAHASAPVAPAAHTSATPTPVTADPAILAERNRAMTIYQLAEPSQKELAEDLIKFGTSIGDAAVTLLNDLKNRLESSSAAAPPPSDTPPSDASPASAASPASIAALAAHLRAVPPIPTTTEARGSLLAEYNQITDPVERAAFFAANQSSILAERSRTGKGVSHG